MKKKLPIGIQTFEKIRSDNYYYVDKTAIALSLIEQGSYYFLSRPRRFGKSLFLDTLKALFEGNESLFKGLAAEKNWDWSIKYPVLKFSFGGGVVKDKAQLDSVLNRQFCILEEKFGIQRSFDYFGDRFSDLIRKVSILKNSRIVVLIDEYDKPILDNIENREVALQMREGLKDFYSAIKDNDTYIKFAFLTGVSKFSKVSIFSGLNNIEDITLSPEYSAICGYTDDDINTIFADQLEGLDRQEIKAWYNGYNWLGQSVYNPFDLLLLFKKREFDAYWFETGTPTFLVKLILERQTYLPDLSTLKTDEEMLSAFDIDEISTEGILFQSGYLTIAEHIRKGGNRFYKLRYPNNEVFRSLNGSLLKGLVNHAQHSRTKADLYDLLEEGQAEGLKPIFHAFFASIPSDWYRNNKITQYEGYYASIFYGYFAALGLDIRVEDSTNHGRIDMTVLLGDYIYIFEFKVVELVPEGRALQQIKDRGYADKYKNSDKTLYMVGVEFSKETRNICAFDVEHVA
jgi:hypothetical protein